VRGVLMGFRYDMRNKSPQQQAIVRQRDNENELSKKESEKKKLESKIITFLETVNEPQRVSVIADKVIDKEAQVLKVLNELVKQNKVEITVKKEEQSKIEIPFYSLKKSV
jgi:TPP-dependent 2-oxoacid decarboxylase